MTSSVLGVDIKASLRELKDGLKWAASFAGAPVELARLGRLETAVAKTLQSWLKRLERLADNLLTALAAEMGPAAPSAKPPAGLFTRLAKTAAGPDLTDEDSGRWRGIRYAGVLGAPPISGACSGRRRRRAQAPIAPPTHEAAGAVPTAGLARRLEALIRIAEQPRRFARRLLRQNARRAERAKRRPPRGRIANQPAWLRPKLPPPRIRWIDTG